MAEAVGADYRSFASLVEAQRDPNGVVILEGDDGGRPRARRLGRPHERAGHVACRARRRPATGDWVLTRPMSFRGDNDRAWNRAADFFLRQLAEVPVERR